MLSLKWVKSLIVCIILVSISGCFSKKTDPKTGAAQDPNGVLMVQLGGEPTVLNPILSTDVPSSAVEGMVYSGLLKVNSSLEMVPDLAESYTIDPTGTIYTFQLKKNVFWHDGQPFSSADVKFTFEKILDARTNTVRRSSFMIDGVPVQFSAPDPLTVVMTLPKPFAPFLTNLGMGVIPKHLYETEDINTSQHNRHPIGTGPFIFHRWETGQFVSLKRNPNYFGSTAKLSSIIYKIIPDANTAMVALQKGEIDEASILAKDLTVLENKTHIDIYQYYDLVYTYMGFNLKHPLFKDPQIRKAIGYAIDKASIVKGVLKDHGQVANIPSSPISWAYPKDPYQSQYSPNKAIRLLNQLGFHRDPKSGLLTKNGQVFEFTLMTNKGNKNREKTAQRIRQFLANIGIQMNIQLMEWNAFIKILGERIDPKKFDACLLGWSLGLDPDGYSIWHSSQYPNGFNFIGYRNQLVDRLLIEGRLETNQENRKQIYSKIFNQIGEDQPYLFLFFPESISGVNHRVKGLSEPGPAGLFNPIENVYVVQ